MADEIDDMRRDVITGFNEWQVEATSLMSSRPKFKTTDSQIVAIDLSTSEVVGVWDEFDGEGTVGLKYVLDDGSYVPSMSEADNNDQEAATHPRKPGR